MLNAPGIVTPTELTTGVPWIRDSVPIVRRIWNGIVLHFTSCLFENFNFPSAFCHIKFELIIKIIKIITAAYSCLIMCDHYNVILKFLWLSSAYVCYIGVILCT